MADLDLIKALSRFDRNTRQIIRTFLQSRPEMEDGPRNDSSQKRVDTDGKKA